MDSNLPTSDIPGFRAEQSKTDALTRKEFEEELRFLSGPNGGVPTSIKRTARRAVDAVFAQNYIKVQAQMITITDTKLSILSNMLVGLEKIQKRLFDDTMIASASLHELMDMFCRCADKIVDLSSDIDRTYKLMRELKEKIPEYNAVGSFREMNSESSINPATRRRLGVAFDLIVGAVNRQRLQEANESAVEGEITPLPPDNDPAN